MTRASAGPSPSASLKLGAKSFWALGSPLLNIFETSLRRGKFDESRKLSDGSLMEFAKVYPLDAVFDTYDDVPEDIRTNKRYAGNENWTVAECAKEVEKDFGTIDIFGALPGERP